MTAAPLTITATSFSITAGSAMPTFTVAYSGLVNGNTAANLSGSLLCTTTAADTNTAGTYPITCSGQTSTNYNITYIPGSLTITGSQHLPLTITANNKTRGYGTPNPYFDATYSGFVNGDTPASLTGTLICDSTGTTFTGVGSYPITCWGQTSTKYTITYVPGTLTITPAPLVITANSFTRLYGDVNPAFTVMYNGFVNGDTTANLSGTLVCTTTATRNSPPGTFPIVCTGLTSNNYVINYNPGNLVVFQLNDGTACGLTQGYWKNHSANWPVTSLMLGSQTYTQAQLLALLNDPVGGDASLILAKQLIAAKLNVPNGTLYSTDGGAIQAADTLLSTFNGMLPYGVSSSSTIGTQMTNLGNALNTFNSDG